MASAPVRVNGQGRTGGRWLALAYLLVALAALSGGFVLAAHHPWSPVALLAAFYLWCAVLAWRPSLWLFVLPASLPLLNFLPWTGWLVFDEFDLAVLGTVAAGYGRLAWQHWQGAALPATAPAARRFGALPVLVLLLTLLGLLGLARGLVDAPELAFDWFAGYGSALNSVRVAKSLFHALLLLPLAQQQLEGGVRRSGDRFALGMVVGLGIVTLAALWERLAFPGLFDFTSRYRTTALFWEMHVGGAAFDAYLALATPFVVWALRGAARPLRWSVVALVALLSGYACLTSFSRSVYVSVLAPLLLLGALFWAQRRGVDIPQFFRVAWRRWRFAGWRPKAALALVLALALEVFLVLGTGSYMRERIDRADQDFASRLRHWDRGLDLLGTGPQWWLGLGLGRLPAHYALSGPKAELSGEVRWLAGAGSGPDAVTVLGPPSNPDLGGLHSLAQRVELDAGQRHRVAFQARVKESADVWVRVCERHLLYDARCQFGFVRLGPTAAAWQPVVLDLRGPPLRSGAWYAPRLGLFLLSVENPGGAADFTGISLRGSKTGELLQNADFGRNLARWFPAAQSYYLPWHIDNLYLELLIERGWSGLVLMLALLLSALWVLVFGAARKHPVAPYLCASLSGAMLVGLMSSLMDVPRVAFLVYWIALYALLLARQPAPAVGEPAMPRSQLRDARK